MNYEAIFQLINKGLSVAAALVEAGTVALPAIQAVQNIVTGAIKEEISDEELARVNVQLDGMIEEFNLELPE